MIKLAFTKKLRRKTLGKFFFFALIVNFFLVLLIHFTKHTLEFDMYSVKESPLGERTYILKTKNNSIVRVGLYSDLYDNIDIEYQYSGEPKKKLYSLSKTYSGWMDMNDSSIKNEFSPWVVFINENVTLLLVFSAVSIFVSLVERINYLVENDYI